MPGKSNLFRSLSVGVPSKDQVAQGTDQSENVVHASGYLGNEHSWFHEIPAHAVKTSTGGGSVDPTEMGTTVNAGTTTDDHASTRAGRFEPNNRRIRRTLAYRLDLDATPTDEIYLGAKFTTDRDADNSSGAYLNLTNEEINVNGTTKAVSYDFGSNDTAILEIVFNDDGKDQTRFRFWTSTVDDGPDFDKVISQVPTWCGEKTTVCVSNGAGDAVRMMYDQTRIEIGGRR